MPLFQTFILPVLLGLLGFFEPCSLSINAIFLSHVQGMKKTERITQGFIFMIVRALMLGSLGFLAAFIGKKLFALQQFYFIALGIVIALLGVYELVKSRLPFALPTIRFAARKKNTSTAMMGLFFGLVIPACAIPLILVLIGSTLLTGSIVQGFMSLFLFGAALSFPLLIIVSSERAAQIMKKIHERVQAIPYVIGAVLIVLGIVTALSSVWWVQ